MRLIQRASVSAFLFLLFFIFAPNQFAQSGKFTIQLEAAPSKAKADEKVKQLKTKSVEAYVLKSEVLGKETFYRVRVKMFPNANEARQFRASLQKQGLVRNFFVAPFERSKEEIAAVNKPVVKPTPVIRNSPAANPPVTTPPNSEPTKSKEPSKEAPKEPAKTENPPKSAGKETTTAAALPANASFTQFRDPAISYTFEYPSYWSSNSLNTDEAKAQRINAGAQFQSSKDSAFLQAIWNELDKANSPTNDNDLIVNVILKSMRSSEGTRTMNEIGRKVTEDKQKEQIKTYLDLRASFQQEQTAQLNFLGKAVIIRTAKGILLVATFYSKDSRPEVASVADRIIASVKAPE